MPIYEQYDPQTGQIYEVWEAEQTGSPPPALEAPPSKPSRAQAFQSAAAQAFGVPPEQVQFGGANTYRAVQGIGSDIPEEALAVYQTMYPDADFRLIQDPASGKQYPVGKLADGTVLAPNRPGLDLGDVVEFSGREGLPMTVAAAVAPFSGPWAPVTAPLAYGATKGLQELGQYLFGTMREDPLEAANRVGKDMAWEAGGTLGVHALSSATGVGAKMIMPMDSPEVVRDVQMIEEGRQQGLELEPLKPYQLTESQPFVHAARQKEKALGSMAARRESQRTKLIENDVPRLTDLPADQADSIVQETVNRLKEEVYEGAPAAPDSYTKAGINATQGLRDVYAKSNQEIRQAYALTDQAQQLEKPQFNFAPVQQLADDLGVEGIAKEKELVEGLIQGLGGKPLTVSDLNKFINVGPPEGRLRRVVALTQALDPTQMDYRVAQRLRTMAGRLHKDFKFEAGDSYQAAMADRLYKGYTEVLRNPTNLGPDSLYVTRFNDATAKAREQFAWMKDTYIRKGLKKDRVPREIYKDFAERPAASLTPDVRSLVDKYSPARGQQLKSDILGSMFQNAQRKGKSMLDSVTELQDNDPEVLRWLTGSDEATATLVKQLNEINAFKAAGYDKLSKQMEVTLGDRVQLLQTRATTPTETRKLVQEFSNAPGGRAALQRTIGDAIVSEAIVKDPKTGTSGIDLGVLAKNMERAKTSGWWSVLSESQRARLQGFEAYVRRTYSPENDMATSLSMGAAGGKVNQVSEWMSLATEQLGHRFIGGWLVNDTVGKAFYTSIKNKASGKRGLPWTTWVGLTAGAMANELTTSGLAEAQINVNQLRQQGMD